ncbi:MULTISPECIES: hypothetical protein [unclassified Campylobacter]|uniref:hypothetical protein n=1 Tax=unclassified Campylobacter TaxID=2593542 RepID=UPI0022E9A609|nr:MULTISPECIES: hypothetical protein [unclassified Campylobacter]MDA3080130.1 hypothetical protein [Campylobacter sp. CS_NA2]MDA3081649.1 hypothetical protein [Campylobacter sp. CS_NA1]MDA3086187.1 hypothetical protein [Campylobacter sp. CS_ED1]MDA3090864.1 hypothetical protein [Campylobacter sp. CS_ED2]WBR51135.1 hypothetical protein PF026_07285 [Campylobacter sp. CS_NA3]
MFFWGYIEDVKREILTDFHISAEPISTTMPTSVGASYIDTRTYTSGGWVSSKTKHTTFWTFDIGDTSFKLISDRLSLKNGDFVVVESYSRDGAYYLAYCILNATKKYSEPSWFPGYLDKRNLPEQPSKIGFLMTISIILPIFSILVLMSGNIFPGIIAGVASFFVSPKWYYESKAASYRYKSELLDITELNN